MEIRIYLTNLAKYNEGCLVGKWIDLPIDEEELNSEIKSILGSDEEYFITDYEAPFHISEYDNPFKLNEFAGNFDGLQEYDQEKVCYLINDIGYSKDDALEKYEDVIFYPDMNLKDVAEELVEEGVFGEITDNIKYYIDYEKLGRDLEIDGYDETDKGVFFYQ